MKIIFQLVRRIRLALKIDQHAFRTISDFREVARDISLLVRFFYLFLAYWVQDVSFALMDIGKTEPTVPLWPIELLGTDFFINQGALVTSMVFPLVFLTFLFPGTFVFRLFSFLFIFIYAAFRNSYGAMFHSMHFMVYISFVLLFLPGNIVKPGLMKHAEVMKTISVFWFSQAILLFSYTMAGINKVLAGGVDVFWSGWLVNTVLNRAVQNGGSPVLWEKVVMDHQYLVHMAHLGNLYLQLISIFVLFRPSLHRTYGVILIAFHFGTIVLLHIAFSPHIIMWGLFFVLSPLAPKDFSLLGMLKSLPVFGFVVRWLYAEENPMKKNVVTAWLVYDGECPFCSQYAKLLNIRDKVGNLILINAREGGEIVEKVKAVPFDLDEGMVFIYGDSYYYGSDALHILSMLSEDKGVFSRINKFLFSSPLLAKISYPVLRAGRNFTLRILGVSKISSD